MGYKATVVGGTLHLRASMDTESAVLADIPNNTSIYVKDIRNPTWIMAVYDNQLGYVMREYLNEYPQQIAYGVEGCQRYGAPLLQQGSEGNDVVDVQCDLWEFQWHSLEVDGIFGPVTAATVRDYQGMHGLVMDGIVGVQTKNSMYSEWLVGKGGVGQKPPHPHGDS